MSVSLLEVIEAGGYDLTTIEDARWLVSKASEFDDLVMDAEELIEEEEQRESDEAEAEYLKIFPKEEDNDVL